MKKCVNCNETYSGKIDFCPKCGGKLKSSMPKYLVAVVPVVVLALIGVVTFNALGHRAGKDSLANDYGDEKKGFISGLLKNDNASASLFVDEEDLKRLEVRYNNLKKINDGEKAKISEYAEAYQKVGNESIEDIVHESLLKAESENTVIALEEKTLLMGALGADVPDVFSPTTDALGEYGDYLTDTVKKGLWATVGGDETREKVEKVEGALSYIGEKVDGGGSIEDVIMEAASDAANGYVTFINEKALDMAVSSMGETAEGVYNIAKGISEAGSVENYISSGIDDKLNSIPLLGTLSDIVSYDRGSSEFYSGVSNGVRKSQEKLMFFLDKQTVTSDDILEMMQTYSQFGNQLHMLNGTYDWENTYNKMALLYDRFVSNEMLAREISKKGIDSNKIAENADKIGISVMKADMDMSKDEEIEFSGIPAIKYKQLTDEISRLEKENEQLASNEMMGLFDDSSNYYSQINNWKMNERYLVIKNFQVDNFEPRYDYDIMDEQKKLNKVNYAIEKISMLDVEGVPLAFFTPGGFAVGLLAAMGADDGAELNSVVASNGTAILNAAEAACVETSKALTELKNKIDFYEGLTERSSDSVEDYRNLVLLTYILDGKDVDFTDDINNTYGKMYLYYRTIKNMRNAYVLSGVKDVDDLDAMCKDMEDYTFGGDYSTEKCATLVSDEDAFKMLQPMKVAMVNIINNYNNNRVAFHINNTVETHKSRKPDATDIELVYIRGSAATIVDAGKYWGFKTYYIGTSPLACEAGGNLVFFDNGKVLGEYSGDENAFYEEMEWIKTNSGDNSSEWSRHARSLKGMAKDASKEE